ncbi:MAG: hypothetical protein ABJ360_19290 [Roseobacter sp.]
MDFTVNFAAVLVLPAVMFSFSRYVARDEYTSLRLSGQKLNLNMHNLRSAYRRKTEDPLRASHVKLAKIGFLHWVAIPVGYFTVFVFAIGLELLQRSVFNLS